MQHPSLKPRLADIISGIVDEGILYKIVVEDLAPLEKQVLAWIKELEAQEKP